jgi:hypothetical protein
MCLPNDETTPYKNVKIEKVMREEYKMIEILLPLLNKL